MFENEADALGRQGGFNVEVAVVEVVIGFQAPVALARQQVFDVEVANELVGVQSFVAITEIAVEQQAVIEQVAGYCHVEFHVGEGAAVGAEVGGEGEVVAELAENVAELRGDGR